MASDPLVWAFRIVWLVLPFTLGDSIDAALAGRSTPVVVAGAAMAWAAWAAALIASFVTLPAGLTLVRWIAPAAPVLSLALWFVSDADGDPALQSATGLIGLVLALVAAAIVLSSQFGDVYANGASYGDERRFALKVPLGLLLAPVPAMWLASVPGIVVGVLALAAKNWALGVPLTLIGVGVSVLASRSVHMLHRRWLVFVPAGVTLVDPLALVDPVLFSKNRITRFGPAFTDTTATDLTGMAPGLALEFSFDMQLDIAKRTGRDGGEVTLVNAVLVCPGRPGQVMAEAQRRGLPTGT